MAENAYYDQIMALKGLSGFKDVVERWQRFSENLTRFQAKKGLVLPDLLWVCDNGIDRSNLLKLPIRRVCNQSAAMVVLLPASKY